MKKASPNLKYNPALLSMQSAVAENKYTPSTGGCCLSTLRSPASILGTASHDPICCSCPPLVAHFPAQPLLPPPKNLYHYHYTSSVAWCEFQKTAWEELVLKIRSKRIQEKGQTQWSCEPGQGLKPGVKCGNLNFQGEDEGLKMLWIFHRALRSNRRNLVKAVENIHRTGNAWRSAAAFISTSVQLQFHRCFSQSHGSSSARAGGSLTMGIFQPKTWGSITVFEDRVWLLRLILPTPLVCDPYQMSG